MFKKITLLFLLIVLILAVIYMFFYDSDKVSVPSNPPISETENPPATDENEPPPNNDDNEQITTKMYIDEVFTLAQEGMIMELSIIAGKSIYEEVVNMYGDPERIDETSVGDFAIYQSPDVSIGYRDNIACDLRSYAKELQDIYYKDILDQLGDPDEIRYYQDQDYDQIILVYHVNDDYQLKWILDKPDTHRENPNVHHISLVALDPAKQNERSPTMDMSIPQLIQDMTIDEKLGQMIFAGISGTELNTETEHIINHYKVGGIIFNAHNIESPSQTVAYINSIKQINSQNKHPLFFGIDQEGGRISKLPGNLKELPSNLEIGKINDPTFSFEIGRLLGTLVKVYGFNINFAPVLDVNSNPNNPVIGDRSFSNHQNIVSELGIQTMKGMQEEKIIPTIKHFPGHGDTSVDSHFELPSVSKSLSELEQLELIPFSHAIEAGADMVMIAHLLLPKIDPKLPSSLSYEIITELLRNQLNYDGVVITDDLTMEAITDHFEIGKAAVMSIQAGSDIVMVAHDYDNVQKVVTELKQTVENGDISEERIDESVTRILNLKRKYEINDTFVEEVNVDELNKQIGAVLNR